MNTLSELAGYIDTYRDRVLDNLNPESIDVYIFLSNRIGECDVSKDRVFQFVFRSFYRMDFAGLKDEFKTEYFRTLQGLRGEEAMIMGRKKKELPLLPEGWREETTERVKKNFLPEIQEEAHRILNRKETVTALAYMIDADSERFSINRILKALRICAYHASVKPPVHSFYRNPKVAARLIASLQTVMKELPFLFDEEDGVSTERMVFEEAIEFIELYSYRRRGKPPPTQKYLCLLHMEKIFRKWFGRPVHESIAAWMKATFPRDYREHFERDRPPVLTIIRELKRARILIRSPAKDIDSNP